MRALCWHGKGDVRVDTVPDPKIQHPRDAIIKITACAICGSDLHLLDGYQPTMESGDILGHENMGEVIELGSEVTNLKIGDRVVVPFTISCGAVLVLPAGPVLLLRPTNPNAEMAIKAMGQSPAGLFGFSHMLGGYSGGQAEYLRVPMADVGPIKIPDSVTDEQALFLSDIFPTGYMAAENAQIEDGDTVAIWGCGPVGQFAIRSALMMGAGRVIAIDEVPERLAMAEAGGAETIDFSKTDVYDELMARTDKRGPDSCIDAVGCEASGHGAADAVLDKVKAATYPRDRPGPCPARGDHVLPQGRHDLDPGRLCRDGRQDPDRRGDEQGPDLQDGPDPCSGLHQAAAREDRGGRNRSELRRHASGQPRGRAGDVQEVPRQGGRRHQGRAAAGLSRRREDDLLYTIAAGFFAFSGTLLRPRSSWCLQSRKGWRPFFRSSCEKSQIDLY